MLNRREGLSGQFRPSPEPGPSHEGSHTATWGAGRPLKVDRMITSAVNVVKPLAMNTYLLSTRKTIAAKVGRLSSDRSTWFSTRKSTLKRGYMSTLDVEGSLHKDLASLNTRELTLGQCLMSAASVGSALKDHFTLVHQRVHMGEKPYKRSECGKSLI